jgi:squalene synthase HpnC
MSLTSSVSHYENFPVASVLVPRRLRPVVASVYWFARSADDIADEGKALPSSRLAALGVYREQLALIGRGETPQHQQFAQLANHIRRFNLPINLFEDLLTAFEQDCRKKRYENWEELQAYCSHSANPVGRLMLHLFDRFSDDRATASDQICTGLQLTNFLQDIRHDWAIGRLYVPLAELRGHGLDETAILQAAQSRQVTPELRDVLQLQHERARLLLYQGRALLPQLPGRLGLEIAATVAGGERLLGKLALQNYSGFAGRPKLTKLDWIGVLTSAIALKFS